MLLPMLRDFPRATVLALYLLDYTSGFLPLLHVTCPPEGVDVTQISWYSYEVRTGGPSATCGSVHRFAERFCSVFAELGACHTAVVDASRWLAPRTTWV